MTFYVNTHDFDLPTMVELSDITPSTYVTCLYDLFWWVGIVSNVDIEQGDVKVDFMHPHGPRKTFNWPESDDNCYVPTKKHSVLSQPPTTSTGRMYKITDEDYQKTVSAFDWAKE